MEEYARNFYWYDIAGHFVDTTDFITEKDLSDESEQNESRNENESDKWVVSDCSYKWLIL